MDPQESALQLADSIVRVQGTRFIRELLRDHQQRGHPVRIGVRKTDVLDNLREAILGGWITLDALKSWLAETEGWGKQHVYLYRPTAQASRLPQLSSVEALEDHLREQGVTPVERPGLLFPDELRLDPVTFEEGVLELSWKKGRYEWTRDSTEDYKKEIDGDLYEFKAWRHEPRRSVQRLVLIPRDRMAALFVQVPLGEEHEQAVAVALGTVTRIIPAEQLPRVSMSEAVRALDQADLDEQEGHIGDGLGRMQAQDTRFQAGGASVEFSADPELESYNAVPEVRRVRRAVRTDEFSGEFARFNVDLDSGTGMRRTVKMSMYGPDDRLYLYSQMRRDEVWAIVDKVLSSLG